MSTFPTSYFDTEGPFGLPMKDKQAQLLEAKLKEIPKDDAFAFRRASYARGLSEFQPEGRADVSWITEESADRAGDVVVAAGMDDSHFALNPLVTLNHDYAAPPVGRSLWRRRVREGTLVGVKAKTHYPPRPTTWQETAWPPDAAFDLVQSGLLLGKSIGFVPLQLREPTAANRRNGMEKVRYIIEKWLLVEYACCYLPMQPNAVVEQVLKSRAIVGTSLLTCPKRDGQVNQRVPTAAAAHRLAEIVRRPAFQKNLEKILQRLLNDDSGSC